MSSPLTIQSRITMNDGVKIPIFGLGAYRLGTDEECMKAISCAIQNGYRMIDTAEYYGNEAIVAKAVQSCDVSREDVFITSKLWTTEGGRQGALDHAKQAVMSMNIGYIDLYLIHAPRGGHVLEAYDALLELKKEGILKSVGVSNFGVKHLEELAKAKRPFPSNNQIELHPWHQKRDVVTYCKNNGITLTAYSPLARAKRFDDPVIVDIAKKTKKTSAQVVLRWSLQNNFVTIPKSSNCKRIIENADVFDFSISEEDFERMYHLGDESWSCIKNPSDSE